MSYIVTGGAGYIGGHLTDRLVESGDVTVLDDLSAGKYRNKKAKLVKVDLRDNLKVGEIKLEKGSEIFHLAANPDVRTSMLDAFDHFSRDVATTAAMLEVARKTDAERFVFTSTSAVYGDAKVFPTPETYPLDPISNYALFKVMCEDMIRYYSKTYGIKAVTIRFANIVGGRMSHGVICDFTNKLMENSSELHILGDGKQKKSYLYISDTIDALCYVPKNGKGNYDVFNVGNVDDVNVESIARVVENELKIKPKHIYDNTLNGRGWKGDVKLMLLDIEKVTKYGWEPRIGSEEAVALAAHDLISGIKTK